MLIGSAGGKEEIMTSLYAGNVVDIAPRFVAGLI